MAFTYRWSDLIVLVSKQVKNIPTQTIDALQCDWVSTRIAGRLPWKMQQQSIADGQIPLVDSQQDYDPPFNIWRLIDASLRCITVTPNDDITISVRDSLPVDLKQRSPYAITSVALQAPEGKLRLSAAPIIPQGASWELRGSYQINPTKVVSTSQILWFDDRYVHVAIEGLTYVYMKMADDPRAGTTSGTWPGDITYTGQLAQFMSAIKELTDAEDIGGDQQVIPDDALGFSTSQYGAMVAAYGTGGGGGANGHGVVSINGDTTPAQSLVGGYLISVTNVGIGSQMISFLGTDGDGGGGGGGGPNFADNVVVVGAGVNWALPNPPNPAASLQLFQQLSGFGQVMLQAGVDYTLVGTAITTVNSIAAGALRAWFRY